MLINNQLAAGEYRHNYIRLAFILGTLLLFIGYIAVCQLFERGNHPASINGTIRPENLRLNEITPSDWVYRSLNALNYLWQFSWLLYSLTFIYRRSSTGYLYLSPNTLTPTFYGIYNLSFLIPAVWLIFLQETYLIWTWVIYLISFVLLSMALFIINNNAAINRKLYETEGFNRDIWCLRFFAQNGVAFFAAWTAIRFILAFDTFLQVFLGLSLATSGTVVLVLAAIFAITFFFIPNFNAALVEQCAYQFAPWIVFIFYFWGVVERNWVPKQATRNNIIAAIELAACVVSGIGALALFAIRYRTSKIDPLV
ncbi:unnamed protein product [Adineta steineri]|uniref:Uncharacterized protein n=2 Tax=Adineta steineri TaxID=433720 RepID=A0A813X3U4_9BILA|nr:unnamed protein product [Adineta steineri]CAF0864140.1 unnamed protein product [Adineta steineri]CAF3570927.1 unnamed protein product [Adineta steineri]CAF3847831.1 unnamed protein product [Adineta steineri]